MLLYVAIGLAVLSVVFWRIEADAFLTKMREALAKKNVFLQVIAIVRAIPSLFPLALDVSLTLAFVSLFGLSGGVTSVAMALAMSNTVSFFISREARKSRARARVQPVYTEPVMGEFVDSINAGFYSRLRSLVDRAEKFSRPHLR
jgi:uncharacterized membrane protein YdjX (TVP38/TMEM64 family)